MHELAVILKGFSRNKDFTSGKNNAKNEGFNLIMEGLAPRI